ncbi:MAG: YtxH domain-containing protein [Longimicrobiales bacterium]|nr:YtxH domain-containing protein [Longimicrobiales bacterium]
MSDNGEEYVIIEHRSGGSFGTFVWGLLIGAAAALLYAPKSGRETREELSESVARLRDEAEGRVREVQDTVTEVVEDARRQFEEGVGAARHAVETGRQAVRESRQEVERRVEESKQAFQAGYDAARAAATDGEPEAGEGGDASDEE